MHKWKTSLEKVFGDVLFGIKAILDGRNIELLMVKNLRIGNFEIVSF